MKPYQRAVAQQLEETFGERSFDFPEAQETLTTTYSSGMETITLQDLFHEGALEWAPDGDGELRLGDWKEALS
jgi:hypothetical protein